MSPLLPSLTPDWIDCGRYGHLLAERAPPHWLTLPPAAVMAMSSRTPSPAGLILQETTLDYLVDTLSTELHDPISARSSARLTDRISNGASTRFTTVDDTPTAPPPWPVVPITSPADFEGLLKLHDAAWTGFQKSGGGLVLRIEPPAHTQDIFGWLPVVDRFFRRHATLPILLDAMGPTDVKGWDQLIRLGSDARIYGLARGIPGLPPDRQSIPIEQLTPLELRRADSILHFYVGEAGAQRVLFGSGLGRNRPVDEGQIHAQAQWFAREREWLDADSAVFILKTNAQRLANRTPAL
ncbi:MAG TPA: hypothetical protein VL860_05450 [Planctomycetota bacterium]|nr:hypothetical protein [Planctomycetota bacterium]